MILRIAAVALVLGISTPVRGDVSPEDAARATALFDKGQKQIDANETDAACASFESSLHLDPQIGTRLNLADCRERQGRLADARILFEQAAIEADQAGKQGRAIFARERSGALDAKLARVELDIAQPLTTGLTIKLAGHELPPAQWSKPQRVLAGPVVVDVSAPGMVPRRIETTARAGAATTLLVPALVPVAAAEDPRPQPVPHVQKPYRSRAPLVVGGIGLGLVAGSLGLVLHARSRYLDAVPTHDDAAVSSAQTEADVASGVAIAGGVAIVIGGVLWLRGRGDHAGVVFAPTPTSSGAVLTLIGAF